MYCCRLARLLQLLEATQRVSLTHQVASARAVGAIRSAILSARRFRVFVTWSLSL